MKITEINGNTNQTGNSVSSVSRTRNENTSIDTQRFEETTFSALDAVCRSTEQSHEEFMSRFTYLTPENVKRSTVPDNTGPPPEFLEFQRNFLKNHPQRGQTVTQSNFKVLNHLSEENQGACAGNILESSLTDMDHKKSQCEENSVDIDILDEEVLGEGIKTETFLHRQGGISDNVKVKVGNFVEDDEADVSDDNSYTPSFTDMKSPTMHIDDAAENNDTTFGGTNKNESSPFCHTGQDILQELSTIQKESNVLQSQTEMQAKSQSQSVIKMDKVNSQLHEPDDLLNLIDNCESDSDNSEDNLVYDPTLDKLNFGEIDEKDTENSSVNYNQEVNKTYLDVRVICDKTKQSQNESRMEESNLNSLRTSDTDQNTVMANNDEVEPFTLDEGFDYDNVTLTPKFNAEEMEIIRNISRLGPVYPQPADENDSEE